MTLHTNLGDIKCEIFCDEVPRTAEVRVLHYQRLLPFSFNFRGCKCIYAHDASIFSVLNVEFQVNISFGS